MRVGHPPVPRVARAVDHLAGSAEANGWRCACSPSLGAFRGPGRRDDPCPIANVYAFEALPLVPGFHDTAPARAGVEALLDLWEHREERKVRLFGVGTDFLKLEYPSA